jgi:hypothetical protein
MHHREILGNSSKVAHFVVRFSPQITIYFWVAGCPRAQTVCLESGGAKVLNFHRSIVPQLEPEPNPQLVLPM